MACQEKGPASSSFSDLVIQPAMPHFLLVTFPAQGHINPALQLAKRLVRAGSCVTFATTAASLSHMLRSTSDLPGLSYASFSDGFDEGWDPRGDLNEYMARLRQVGHQTFAELVRSIVAEGRRPACVIYNFLLPWAAAVARDVGLPSVLLWIQPASVFAVYYHYFHGYNSVIDKALNESGPSSAVKLPGLPPLERRDLPSILASSNPYSDLNNTMRELFDSLKDSDRVLGNTFDALEPEALTAIGSVAVAGIGPLLPSAFLEESNNSDTAYGWSLTEEDGGCVKWLDSKPAWSVVYVSFGSFSVLPRKQMEEIHRGLAASKRPYLWVIRKQPGGDENEAAFAAGEEGLIVPWCPQVEVLSHGSVGCFVSHCGWNSTTESLAAGVPVVGFPQWTDQMTNVKMVEDVWKTGVRALVNGDGVIESGELIRCLELVMGGDPEIRRNAERWRTAAREAVAEGGSSHKNIRAFVEAMSCDGHPGGAESR